MLQAHTLQPARGSRKGKKRVGRGNASGRGTTAGRGTKGQRARAGGRGGLKRLGYKMILQRIPKRRGFNSLAPQVTAVTLGKLETTFADGEKVTLQKLAKRGLIKNGERAKIISSKTVTKKLIIVDIPASASAKEAVEKAGGSFVASSSSSSPAAKA